MSFKEEPVIYSIFGGLLLLVAFLLFVIGEMCWFSYYPPARHGVIVGLHYAPSTSTTGVGTAVDANGNVGTVVTTSSEPEKWTVAVQDGGQIIMASTTAKTYYSLKNEQKIDYYVRTGKLTHFGYGAEIP